jgi:hypothetical protein
VLSYYCIDNDHDEDADYDDDEMMMIMMIWFHILFTTRIKILMMIYDDDGSDDV